MARAGCRVESFFQLPADFIRHPELLERSYTLAEAQAYTRWLARTHYENFHVVSLLLPRALHQDFFNLYAYCRWADDLGDELGNPETSLRWLAWWRQQLEAMYAGETRHPVFIALADTAHRRKLPKHLLEDLLRAFVQDQTVHRYESWDQLLEYCRYSANPVGRLVLRLCGYSDPSLDRLSDATCTALQLTNFWQDVVPDWQRGRLYIPLAVLRKHGSSEEDVRQRKATAGFRAALQEGVELARKFFAEGLPLASRVSARLSFDLALFSFGGLCVLEKIEAQSYDVLSQRPSLNRSDRLRVMLRAARYLLGLSTA